MTEQTTSHFTDANEREKFSKMAEDWWNIDGKMKMLHAFNPVRIDYIKEQLCAAHVRGASPHKPLRGLKILDVGCGGGILSESLHIMGAQVVGIDVTEKMIHVASYHAKQQNFKIDYRQQNIDTVKASGETFDCITVLEVVEHVVDVENFLLTCGACLRQGGSLFVSTINRTVKAYLLAIIGAEYILGWLPKGTHQWHKFLQPSEICAILRENHINPRDMVGFTYNILEEAWKVKEKNLDVNYLIHFIKQNAE